MDAAAVAVFAQILICEFGEEKKKPEHWDFTQKNARFDPVEPQCCLQNSKYDINFSQYFSLSLVLFIYLFFQMETYEF